MSLIPLKIPPGVFRNGTNYQAAGRWFDANLTRWYEGQQRPVGGWVRVSSTNLNGPGRGILTWRPFSNSRLAAIGTPNDLWIWDDDSISNITPALFPAGLVDTFYGVGYGFGDYGAGPYGETGGAGTKTDATTWSLDTWGENLVACATHDGVIYEWALDTGTPPAAVVNAPEARSIFVTAEGILVAVGADGNLRLLKWCDQQNNTMWVRMPTTMSAKNRSSRTARC